MLVWLSFVSCSMLHHRTRGYTNMILLGTLLFLINMILQETKLSHTSMTQPETKLSHTSMTQQEIQLSRTSMIHQVTRLSHMKKTPMDGERNSKKLIHNIGKQLDMKIKIHSF